MGLRMKHFNIMEGSLKNPIFRVGGGGREGFPKSQYIEGNCLKRKVGQFPDLRGAWQKKAGTVFERGGGDTLMHTMRVM